MAETETVRLQSHRGATQRNTAGPTTLIVEDLPATQHWLAALVATAFPSGSVLVAGSVCAALQLVTNRPIDLALVDLFLPDGSGVDVIQQLAQRDPLSVCIIATIYDDDRYLLPALAAGAQGYLLKDQPEEVLIEQLRLTVEGVPPLAPAVARRLLQGFAAAGSAQTPPQSAVAHSPEPDDLAMLSRREEVVLSLIGKGLQIAHVARALNISPHTVCSHIKSIYRKRHVSCRAEAALEAQRLGLI